MSSPNSEFIIVGKCHFQGVSKKSGNSYDFCVIYVVYPPSSGSRVEGSCVGEFQCTEEFYNSVVPGSVYSGLFKSLNGLVTSGVEISAG